MRASMTVWEKQGRCESECAGTECAVYAIYGIRCTRCPAGEWRTDEPPWSGIPSRLTPFHRHAGFSSVGTWNACRRNTNCAIPRIFCSYPSRIMVHSGRNDAITLIDQEKISGHDFLGCRNPTTFSIKPPNQARSEGRLTAPNDSAGQCQVMVYIVYLCIHVVVVNKPAPILCITNARRYKSSTCRTNNPLRSMCGRSS
jgi:hypothetical protein